MIKKLSLLLAVLTVVSAFTCTPVLAQESVPPEESYVDYGEHRCTVTVVEPTCKAEGKTTYECVDCGEKFEVVSPALGHTQQTVSLDSTYFKKGYKDRVICSVCDEVLQTGETIEKLQLPKVKILTVKTVACDTVKITWKKVEDAQGYIIYKKEKGAKNFKKVKKVDGACKAKISGLICGKKYIVQIKAYVSQNKKTVTSKEVKNKEVQICFDSIKKFEIKTSQYCFPLEGKKANVTSLYGWRYLNGYKDWHNGVDIAGDTGDKLMAFKSGIVEKTLYDPYGWGNYVLIYHGKVNGKKIYSGYAHLSKISVKKGDKIVQGEKLGEVGNTGHSFGSHLHFEIYKGGSNPATDRVNPMGYLNLKAEKGWQKVR